LDARWRLAFYTSGTTLSTMVRKTREQLKINVVQYLKNNPNATVSEVSAALSVNIHRLFGGIENAYLKSGIKYPRTRRVRHVVKEQIIQNIKRNKLITIEEIQEKLGVNIYRYFRNLEEAYKMAGVEFIPKHLKRRIKKEKNVTDYIRSHPDATQWEINKRCNCHIQEMFEDGIREAFAKAGISYPENRRKIYGSAIKSIRQKSMDFEHSISNKLRKIGAEVQVKTKSGIADAVVNINKKPFVVEIKSYKAKPISLSDINQIKRYMDDLNIKNGIIINSCAKEIRKIKSGRREIIITNEDGIREIWGYSLTRQDKVIS
jgi:hypothetical protein